MHYIIKNCPAFNKYTRQCRGAYNRKIKFQYCSGNTEENCPLKQIVEECKRVDSECFDQWCFANLILEKLEIEVIND